MTQNTVNPLVVNWDLEGPKVSDYFATFGGYMFDPEKPATAPLFDPLNLRQFKNYFLSMQALSMSECPEGLNALDTYLRALILEGAVNDGKGMYNPKIMRPNTPAFWSVYAFKRVSEKLPPKDHPLALDSMNILLFTLEIHLSGFLDLFSSQFMEVELPKVFESLEGLEKSLTALDYPHDALVLRRTLNSLEALVKKLNRITPAESTIFRTDVGVEKGFAGRTCMSLPGYFPKPVLSKGITYVLSESLKLLLEQRMVTVLTKVASFVDIPLEIALIFEEVPEEQRPNAGEFGFKYDYAGDFDGLGVYVKVPKEGIETALLLERWEDFIFMSLLPEHFKKTYAPGVCFLVDYSFKLKENQAFLGSLLRRLCFDATPVKDLVVGALAANFHAEAMSVEDALLWMYDRLHIPNNKDAFGKLASYCNVNPDLLGSNLQTIVTSPGEIIAAAQGVMQVLALSAQDLEEVKPLLSEWITTTAGIIPLKVYKQALAEI